MNKGFSTVEIMIAMAIIIISVSAVLLVCFGNQNFLIGGQTNSEALGIAQGLLEGSQANARKDFRMVNSTATTTDGYYSQWTSVGPSSSSTDYFTKQVTSYVTWSDDSKIKRSVQFSTLITNFENAIGGDTCSSFLTGNWKNPTATNFTLGNLAGDAGSQHPITSLDTYGRRIYVTVSQSSPTTLGPVTTAATASDVSISGGITWGSPNNAKTSDGSNSSSSSSLNSTKVTDYLRLTGFGFAIPASATVVGIKVEIQKSRASSGSGNIVDSQVKIVKNNVIGGSANINKADTTTSWSSSNTYATYTTDLWGENWTPADINNANFGVAISATGSSGGSRIAQVDNVRITVTYTRQFYILNATNPTSISFISSLGSNTVTTGLNAVKTDGHFAYVATNAGPASGQLQIIDVSVLPPVATTTYAVPGVTGTGTQAIGNSIFYRNGYVYLGLAKTATGPEFNVIDVHNPKNPVWIGGYSVGSAVNDIYVRNNTAYITTSDSARELITLDVSNPATPTVKFAYNATPEQSGFGFGKSQYIVGDSWYLGRTYISNAPEFSFIDASTSAPLLLKTLDTGPNSTNPFSLNGIVVRDSLAFLLTGSGTKGGQLQIVNATSTAQYASPVSLPNGSAGVGGVSLDCEGNYLYAGSVDTTNIGYITVVTSS